jgi:hypothetical protein
VDDPGVADLAGKFLPLPAVSTPCTLGKAAAGLVIDCTAMMVQGDMHAVANQHASVDPCVADVFVKVQIVLRVFFSWITLQQMDKRRDRGSCVRNNQNLKQG